MAESPCLYQVWKGNNKFLLKGRLVFGPDATKALILTGTLILLPVAMNMSSSPRQTTNNMAFQSPLSCSSPQISSHGGGLHINSAGSPNTHLPSGGDMMDANEYQSSVHKIINQMVMPSFSSSQLGINNNNSNNDVKSHVLSNGNNNYLVGSTSIGFRNMAGNNGRSSGLGNTNNNSYGRTVVVGGGGNNTIGTMSMSSREQGITMNDMGNQLHNGFNNLQCHRSRAMRGTRRKMKQP